MDREMTLTPAEIETLRRSVGHHHLLCVRSDEAPYCSCGRDESLAILDRLSPPAPEPDVDEATVWTRKMWGTENDGAYDCDTFFQDARTIIAELIASKDGEIATLSELRKVAARNAGAADRARFKAESELAALRAENERLKGAFIRLLDATDRFNGICAHNKQPMARLQGDMILAVMNAYRVLGIGRTKAAERNTAEPAKETTVSYDPNYKCPSCGVAIGVLHEPDCALMLSRTAKPAKTHVWPATHDDACSEIKGAETTPEVVVTPLVPTFEQAEVYRKHITEAEARGRREALEAATARLEWYRQYGAGMIDQRGFAASLIAELKRMMTGGK